MAIEWSDDLLVGNEVIDRQHREIFKRYNVLLDACKIGKGRDGLLEILNFLATYVDEHFATEEKLMADVGYPDINGHKGEHRDFRTLALALHAEAVKDGPTLSLMAETNRKMLDWLVRHIRKSDRELAAYINKQWGLL